MLNRNTYVEVNLKNIRENVTKIVQAYPEYTYYFGVVKADCYGHQGIESVKAIIDGGCNYLAVATLGEALQIRKEILDIPILCLGVISPEVICEAIQNNITVTISSLSYLKEILDYLDKNLKVHIKINTGMNRLGISSKEEFAKVNSILREREVLIEGIYTHIYQASAKENYQKQIKVFEEITSCVDLKEIPIVHICASEALCNYPKESFANGCRLGIIMYGFTNQMQLKLKSTFSLFSEVIQINEVKKRRNSRV